MFDMEHTVRLPSWNDILSSVTTMFHQLPQLSACALQVINLVGAEVAEVASACEVELPQLERWLTAGSGDSTRSKPAAEAALPAEAQVRVHNWLASQAAQLSSAKNGSAHLLASKVSIPCLCPWSLPAGAEQRSRRPYEPKSVKQPLDGRALRPARVQVCSDEMSPLLQQAAILSTRLGELDADSLPESWSAWLQTLRAEEGPEAEAAAPVWQLLDAVHPYTEMMLHRPPTTYVEKPDALGPSRDGGTATPSALTPTVSGQRPTGRPRAGPRPPCCMHPQPAQADGEPAFHLCVCTLVLTLLLWSLMQTRSCNHGNGRGDVGRPSLHVQPIKYSRCSMQASTAEERRTPQRIPPPQGPAACPPRAGAPQLWARPSRRQPSSPLLAWQLLPRLCRQRRATPQVWAPASEVAGLPPW